MLINPLAMYGHGMKEGIPILSGHGGSCGRKRTKGESSPMTPSLSSVMSQIKKYSGSYSSGSSSSLLDEGREFDDDAALEEDPFQYSHWIHGMKRKLSEETTTTVSTLNSQDSHPLAVEVSSREVEMPALKSLNMGDLDLETSWAVDDIVERYPPVYERGRLRRPSVDFEFNKTRSRSIGSSSSIFYDSDKVELEQWPLEMEGSGVPCEDSRELVLPNKRTRQQSLNPNFFKLYSIEMSSKSKRLLPDISVDEQILKQLSYQELRSLNIQPNTISQEHVTADDIKLALITRKKLWSDMIHDQRQDLFGEAVPWNLKFVASSKEDSSDSKKTSLVRVQSDLKPWFADNHNLNNTMLKPCGKLRLGSSPNATEIQYVVKGWCDQRFSQTRS